MTIPRKIRPFIQPNAPFMLVGENSYSSDIAAGRPFAGTTGLELAKMLQEVGITFGGCSQSVVCKYTPPKGDIKEWFFDKECTKPNNFIQEGLAELKEEISRARPKVIFALGGAALWALTGKTGIMKWRGSYLTLREDWLPEGATNPIWVLPSFSPAIIQRMWDWRWICIQDLRRGSDILKSEPKRPEFKFTIRPTLDQTIDRLDWLLDRLSSGPMRLAADIETRGSRTACIGLGWSKTQAICIPLMAKDTPDHSYWREDEELIIMARIQQILTHENCELIGQNWGYDAQYFVAHNGFLPIPRWDTMLMHHAFLPGVKKSLDFICSMFNEWYVYWKDDGKHWDPKMPEEQYWTYNCEDCVRTFEACENLIPVMEKTGAMAAYDYMLELWPHVVKMMIRGVRRDTQETAKMGMELFQLAEKINQEVEFILGHPINLGSPKQLSTLFYEDFGLEVVRNRKTGRPTTDDDAMQIFPRREPLLSGLCERISMYRSAKVLMSTFVQMPLDEDGRMRCYYNVAGAETFRFTSSENAFGNGGNLQNVPNGDEEGSKEMQKKLDWIAKGHTQLIVPNVRKLFIPDPGKEFFDIDLNRADLMVVIWEADDEELRQAVAEGHDIHTLNAMALFGVRKEGVTYHMRQLAKVFAHGTNYGGSARTMAINCGVLVAEADRMQKRWFEAHPGILKWHERTADLLARQRIARNAFGYSIRFFDRVESVFPQALAWVPQSTVAIVINRALINISNNVPECELLLQVHDSLAGQYPAHMRNQVLRRIHAESRIVVPYEKPLIIETGVKVSKKSWGDCEGVDWPEPLAA